MCGSVCYFFIWPTFCYCVFFFFFAPSATVECYNPRTNEWTYVAKMNEPHYGHAGTVYGGFMYISGKARLSVSLSLFVCLSVLEMVIFTDLHRCTDIEVHKAIAPI